MISATKKILANIKSPTLREVLKENIGISRYDKYSNNSHRTNELDPDGLESFCEFVYKDWGKSLIKNINILPNEAKKVAQVLKTNKSFSPSNMKTKQTENAPFYDFFASEYDKHFKGSGTRILSLQESTMSMYPYENIVSDNFMHVYGFVLSNKSLDNVEARLYLNLKAKNIPSFAKEAYIKCRERDLPFYFKFRMHDNCNDPFLFYTSYNDIPAYIEIIEEIKAENPNLLEGTNLISNKLGVLNGYIGYGDEPSSKLEKKESFSSLRENLISDIKKEIMSSTSNIYKYNSNLLFENKVKSTINQKLDTSVKLSGFDINRKEKIKTAFTSSFMNKFYNYLLTGKEFNNIKVNAITINVNLNDFIDTLLKDIPTKFDSSIEKRGFLVQQMFFSNYNNMNKNDSLLFANVKNALIKGLNEDLKKAKSASETEDLKKYIQVISAAPKNEIGKAITKIAAANFLQTGRLLVNGYKSQFVYPEYSLKLHEFILGNKTVENIINNVCNKYHCSNNLFCFNKETELELDMIAYNKV